MNIGEFGGTDHQVLHPNEMPAHGHGYVDSYFAENNAPDKSFGNNTIPGSKGGFDNDNSLFSGNRNTANAGASWGHNNMPPYYVLAYIMKL